MLRLEYRRARKLVSPVAELDLVEVRVDLFDLQTICPRKNEPLLGALEVILDVTLAAHVSTHLVLRRLLVHVVVLNALRCLVRADALDERRAADSQRHVLSIVAVDAGDWMLYELHSFAVRHRVDLLEA